MFYGKIDHICKDLRLVSGFTYTSRFLSVAKFWKCQRLFLLSKHDDHKHGSLIDTASYLAFHSVKVEYYSPKEITKTLHFIAVLILLLAINSNIIFYISLSVLNWLIIAITIIINKCSLFGCFTNYEGYARVFELKSVKDVDWIQQWLIFCNRSHLNPNSRVFICEKRFKERFIMRRNVQQTRLTNKAISSCSSYIRQQTVISSNYFAST